MPRNTLEDNRNEESGLDIMTVIGHDLLEGIQEAVANVTGIAFVTVDYKGDVLTEATRFCNYCKKIRDNPTSSLLCKLSDASGAIIAATNKEVSIYICPCGLLEIAIPIIVDGHYLGGFIGGQILCDDVPDTIVRLSKNMVPGGAQLVNQDIETTNPEELADIKRYSYNEALSIAKLVEFIINQLTNHEIVSNRNKQKNLNRIEALEKEVLEAEDKICCLQSELEKYKRYVDMVRNCKLLSVVDSLSVVEEAEKTEAAILDYIHVLALHHDSLFETSIKEECSRIESTVSLLNYREDCHIGWHMDVDESLWHYMLPSYSVWQYVYQVAERAQQEGYAKISMKLHAELQGDQVCIIIEDDTLQIHSDEVLVLHKLLQDVTRLIHGDTIESTLSPTSQAILKLHQTFIEYHGTSAKVHCYPLPKGGIQVMLSYPVE